MILVFFSPGRRWVNRIGPSLRIDGPGPADGPNPLTPIRSGALVSYEALGSASGKADVLSVHMHPTPWVRVADRKLKADRSMLDQHQIS